MMARVKVGLMALLALFALAGCTKPLLGGPLLGGVDQAVGAAMVDDLKQAATDAAANHDAATIPCYAALLPFAQKLADPAAEAHGLFTAVQKQRDLARAGLDTACGPVAIDMLLMTQKLWPIVQ